MEVDNTAPAPAPAPAPATSQNIDVPVGTKRKIEFAPGKFAEITRMHPDRHFGIEPKK